MSEVLCLYQWNEKRAKQLHSWLKNDPKRYVVFLEEDPSILLTVPKTQQLKVIAPTESNLRKLVWELVFLPFSFEGQNPHRAFLEQFHAEVSYAVSDYADQGVAVFQNLRANLSHLDSTLETPDYRGIPAIICGAGPSLAKNGKLLKNFRAKALIFAGGAALEALRTLEVEPHFGAHLDPASLHRFSATQTPTFYQLRTAAETMKTVQGPKILCPSAGIFPLETWAQEQLGMTTELFDGGWTVGTFCLSLALSFGCNPIILIGMDLAAHQNKQYASGVTTKHPTETLHPIQNQKGECLWARRDWVLAAQWIEQLQKRHPEVKIINATEGGVGFEGIEERKLAEVCLETVSLPSQLPTKPPLATNPLAIIEESLLRAHDHVQAMLKEVEQIFPASPLGNGTLALLEHQLHEELIYQKFLQPAWLVWKHVIERSNPDGEMGLYLNELLFYQNLLATLTSHVAC